MKAKAMAAGTDADFATGTIVEVVSSNGATFKFKDPATDDTWVGAWHDCAFLDGGWWEKIQ